MSNHYNNHNEMLIFSTKKFVYIPSSLELNNCRNSDRKQFMTKREKSSG